MRKKEDNKLNRPSTHQDIYLQSKDQSQEKSKGKSQMARAGTDPKLPELQCIHSYVEQTLWYAQSVSYWDLYRKEDSTSLSRGNKNFVILVAK